MFSLSKDTLVPPKYNPAHLPLNLPLPLHPSPPNLPREIPPPTYTPTRRPKTQPAPPPLQTPPHLNLVYRHPALLHHRNSDPPHYPHHALFHAESTGYRRDVTNPCRVHGEIAAEDAAVERCETDLRGDTRDAGFGRTACEKGREGAGESGGGV